MRVGNRLLTALALAGASMALLLGAGSQASANGAVMKLSPASQNVEVTAASLKVDVMLEGGSNVGAMEVSLRYDPSVLEFVSVAEGPYLKSTGLPTTCLSADFGADVVNYGCGVMGSNPPGVNGTGLFATFTFKPKAQGVSTLVFVKRELATPLGAGLAVDSSDGVVSVVAAGGTNQPLQPTPTPDPIVLTPTNRPAPERDPFVRDPANTPVPSTGSSSGGSNAGDNAGSGVAGSTGSSAAGTIQHSAGQSGTDGFPRAGTGPGESEHERWLRVAVIVLLAGFAATMVGRILRVRRETEL